MEEARREHDRVRRQLTQTSLQFIDRQSGQDFDCEPACQDGTLRTQERFPFTIPRAGAGHADKMTRPRTQAKRLLDSADEVVIERGADHIQWQQRLFGRYVDGTRHARSGPAGILLSVSKNEVQCPFGPDDDHIRRVRGILFAQIGDNGPLVGLSTELVRLEEFGGMLDGQFGMSREHLRQRAVDLDVRRQKAALRIDHQDVASVFGQDCRGRRYQTECDRGRGN